MDVLITHECSGVVRDAFLARGHNAFSCDLKPGNGPRHLQMDAVAAIRSRKWDFMGMHCECRYLCGSGLHWNKRRPDRAALTEEAYAHVMACVDAADETGAAWYLENSIGMLSTRWRKPDQVIQPYDFGEDASKATCLWLNNLPLLTPTLRVPGRIVNGRERWANQTDSGQNRLAPSATRSADRAKTYPGIAAAMAEQWGGESFTSHPQPIGAFGEPCE